MPRFLVGLFSLLLLLSISGCASGGGAPITRDELYAGDLAFLRVGATTRREALLRLGQPSASFEDQSILTWRLAVWNEDGQIRVVFPETRYDARVADWRVASWSLVLVFDREGTLSDHSLVSVK